MALVTVCIPAYRAAAFIGHTLASVQRQTFSDYRVILALEPEDATETMAAAERFLADERFDYYVNGRSLGYAENVRSVLGHVQTPSFACNRSEAPLGSFDGQLADRLLSFPGGTARRITFGDSRPT